MPRPRLTDAAQPYDHVRENVDREALISRSTTHSSSIGIYYRVPMIEPSLDDIDHGIHDFLEEED